MASVAAGSLSCRKDSSPPSGREITLVVLKQYGAGSELVHCQVTLTVETFVTRPVTSEGVGGANDVQRHGSNQ